MAEYTLLIAMLVVLVLSTMNIYVGPLGGLYEQIQTTFDAVMGPLTI